MIQQILTEISGKLVALGIPVQYGMGADITVSEEFLDASWSTGQKKISYEASVFADERSRTVYMYERTMETGSGFSFGGSSSTSFQSGKTLFRKVKSVQYGPDGKAYEYSLDLGAIPKAVKETAESYGWKFKTVINKNKAVYPVGYTPAFVLQENSATNVPIQPVTTQTPAQRQFDDPEGVIYTDTNKKSGRKAGFPGLIAYILLGILLLVFLFAAEATLIGWVVSIGIFAIAFFTQRKLKKRGCLLQLILWIVTGFLLLVSLTIFTTGDLSFTTAGIKNAHMTTAIDANGEPVDKVDSYSQTAQELVAVAELRNAPPNTQVKFEWYYVTEDMLITEYLMDSGDSDANVYVFSNLTNDKPWPEGEYEVRIYTGDRQSPDATITFEVTSGSGSAAAAGTSSQSLAAALPYEKSFPLNDGKSVGTLKLFISDGTGLYESYQGEVICEFSVKFDTSSLSSDFKMHPGQATENDATGSPAYDGLVMSVCSDTQAYHLSSLSYAEYIYNNGEIRPYVETDGATTNMNAAGIIELAQKYPKMQILRYNVNEVGMTQEGDSWITHAEKSFGLHPPVTEGNIPWDEIVSDLGLN